MQKKKEMGAQQYSRFQKEHSKELYINYVVITQNIIKWLIAILSFHKLLLGFSCYELGTLKHCRSIINSLKINLLSCLTLHPAPYAPCSYRFPGFKRRFPSFWQPTGHPFLKAQLKNSPDMGHAWINSTLAYFDDSFTVFHQNEAPLTC